MAELSRNNISVYPLGFISRHIDGHDDLTGDVYIDDLFREYQQTRSSIDLKRVRLDTIYYMFAFFDHWDYNFTDVINCNIVGGKLSTMQIRFLRDTVNYINTGRRSVSVEDWMFILFDEYKSNKDHQKELRKLDIAQQVIPKGFIDNKNFINQWLSHKDGFRDMIWVLKIMFGTPN